MMDNRSLYTMLDFTFGLYEPWAAQVKQFRQFIESPTTSLMQNEYFRSLALGLELVEQLPHYGTKPAWGIDHTFIDGQKVDVLRHVVARKNFCHLMHFKKQLPRGMKREEPKLLIIAPLSGHYATLLRGTVQDMLPYFDVYITDWINARDVPLTQGSFDLDDYIHYVIDFLHHTGENTHTMAVCQPTVPVMAAACLMSTQQDPCRPKSMVLIGGPIDARKGPTKVNSLATDNTPQWFTENVISLVPSRYPGRMRAVYPGIMQLFGFLSMNPTRHLDSFMQLHQNIARGQEKDVEAITKFYREYLSVMDLTAEFYMQTILTVFQRHDLPKGEMVSHGKPVRPDDIRDIAILALEGENDDIAGIGQTHAALHITPNLPKEMKEYHLQKGVGHYGLFNGRKFREQIVPDICRFLSRFDKNVKVPKVSLVAA